MMNGNSLNRQRSLAGFTLVELLVGLVLTIFIGAVALTYMVSTSRSFRVTMNDSLSQENARFALELLGQNIRLAGLNPDNDFNFTMDIVYNGNRCVASDASNSNGDNAACTLDNLSVGSDRFAVDFIATDRGADYVGCNGTNYTISGASKRMANVFWTADIDGDGVRSLYCQTLNITDSQIEGPAAPLIDGVDAMQVQYGVDSDGDGYVDRYQNYGNLVAGLTIPSNITQSVKTISLALLVNSGAVETADSATEQRVSETYQLLDDAPRSYAADGIQRQIYSSTFLVPNSQ